MVIKELTQHLEVVQKVITTIADDIELASQVLQRAILDGKKLLLVGNGGSAADAQHIAAEFTGRFVKERKPLAAIALTTDTSALTAIGNDYGYNQVFARQVEALATSGDVLIAISTSGNSQSIINAIEKAREAGCAVIGLTGNDGGDMDGKCDINIIVPATVTARIQEIHILIGHIFCKAVDELY